jgi:hypothetical protein
MAAMRLPTILVAAALATPLWGPQPLAGEGLEITDVLTPKLRLYEEGNGRSDYNDISKSKVELPIEVYEVSAADYLLVVTQPDRGWVKAGHVETNQPPKVTVHCETTIAADEAVMASRGAAGDRICR